VKSVAFIWGMLDQMYKRASRSGQRLRESGRSATNQRKRTGSGAKWKSKAHKELDATSKRIQTQQWVNYILACQEQGTTPDDPPDELREAVQHVINAKSEEGR
jgi:hypothetical protein